MAPAKKLLIAVVVLILFLLYGTIGFMFLEHFNFLEALWASVATLTTVGYFLNKPVTLLGKIHALLLMILGVAGVAYAFGTIISILVEGQLSNDRGRKKMQKKIEALHDHIIICGAGRVGGNVVDRLHREKIPLVVIDQKEKIIENLQEKSIPCIAGDATKDEVLLKARIDKARGIVSALSSDAENVFVTLTCKELNPKVKVVARCDSFETEMKLYRAGADQVILPSAIGGRRMAISILKPLSIEFVETLIHDDDFEIEIEEIHVAANASITNKKIKESQIKQKTGAMVVAIKRGKEFISNPGADDMIQSNDTLIVLGTRAQLENLEKLAN